MSAHGRSVALIPQRAARRAMTCSPGPSPRRRPGPNERSRRAQRGFAYVAAIFLLVVLGAFAAFAVDIGTKAATGGALAVQGVRAHEAARAGLEWARFQIRDPNGNLAPGPTQLPDCFASPRTLALPAELAPFNVVLTCARTPPAGAAPNFHEDGDRRLAIYTVTATASFGAPGGIDYVERRLEARIERCKDAAAPAPRHAC
jgi:MSHA biogenesis protein MshP